MFSVLYAFQNQAFYIVEVKRLDLAEDAPKGDVYHWLYINGELGTVKPLEFCSMSMAEGQNNREFSDAHLHFDDCEAVYKPVGESRQTFKVLDGGHVAKDVRALIQTALNRM